jgi:uncharacterized protein
MKFVEYQDVARHRIRAIEANRIRVDQTWVTLPCALSAHQLITNWQPEQDMISVVDIEKLLALAPADLILIGQAKPLTWDANWFQLQANLNQRDIGIEQMPLAAAARTFSVLTTEERPIWLILNA